MTICIAALADKKKKIVLAADQMITANVPIPYEFETDDVRKIYDLTPNVVVMTAGNALFANEIVEGAIRQIAANSPNTVEDTAEIIRQLYQGYRRNLVVQQYLEPRGLNLETYYANQTKLHPGLVQEIESQLAGFNVGVDLIVAGHNSEECHIYTITHPGILLSHDEIGFVCVGSGAPHAMYHLIGSTYKKTMSLSEVDALVKEAKEKSEKAPGVGKETTVIHLPKEQDAKRTATKS